LTAARELGERPQEDLADTLRNALAKEADAEVRDTLRLALALTMCSIPALRPISRRSRPWSTS